VKKLLTLKKYYNVYAIRCQASAENARASGKPEPFKPLKIIKMKTLLKITGAISLTCFFLFIMVTMTFQLHQLPEIIKYATMYDLLVATITGLAWMTLFEINNTTLNRL
jgi:hypothetical protein